MKRRSLPLQSTRTIITRARRSSVSRDGDVTMKSRNSSEVFPRSVPSEANSGKSPVYRLGAVEVDLAQGSLRRDGAEQDVRPKTMQVLAKLLEQRRRIVTKQE